MTKKKVEVNEDVLKNIIVGDIPIFGREKPKEESTEQPETEVPPITEPAEAPSEKTVAAKPRKRKRKRVAIGKGIWSIFRHPTVPMSI